MPTRPQSSSSSPNLRAYARIAASTASTCRRRDSDSVQEQKRSQACSRERGSDMAVTLAQPRGQSPAVPIMEKLLIEGGVPLSGTIVPAGNKNAALPLLACSLLTDEEVILHNAPRIRDVDAMLQMLADLGVTIRWLDDNTVSLQADNVTKTDVAAALAERIRASFLAAGPLLARFGSAHMPPPGGDVIGRRRLDPHLDAFKALRRCIEHPADFVIEAPNHGLQAVDFFMDEPSVMGTENALMAAALT